MLGFYILKVLLLLGAIGMIGVTFAPGFEGPKRRLCFGGFICGLLFLGSLFITVVPANNVGIRYSALGGTSEQTLSEGFNYKIPFIETIYDIDTTVQERTCKNITIQTKDSQFVTMKINIKYQVDADNAFKVYKGYKTLENLNTNLIKNAAQDALNDVYSEYNIVDALGAKQPEVRKQTMKVLSETYEKHGVTLVGLTFEDVDAGDDIEKAITDEAVAKKEVETAKQQKEKAQIDAEKKLIEAQGEADANAVKNAELTENILKEQWIEKWDGKLSTVQGSSSGIMLDIGDLTGN